MTARELAADILADHGLSLDDLTCPACALPASGVSWACACFAAGLAATVERTAGLADDVRRRHFAYTARLGTPGLYCVKCGIPWPCDAVRMADLAAPA
jgi:hypothetical protein